MVETSLKVAHPIPFISAASTVPLSSESDRQSPGQCNYQWWEHSSRTTRTLVLVEHHPRVPSCIVVCWERHSWTGSVTGSVHVDLLQGSLDSSIIDLIIIFYFQTKQLGSFSS